MKTCYIMGDTLSFFSFLSLSFFLPSFLSTIPLPSFFSFINMVVISTTHLLTRRPTWPQLLTAFPVVVSDNLPLSPPSGVVTSETFLGNLCSRLCVCVCVCLCVNISSGDIFFLKLCSVTQKSLICIPPSLLYYMLVRASGLQLLGVCLYSTKLNFSLLAFPHSYRVFFQTKQMYSPFGGIERSQETLSRVIWCFVGNSLFWLIRSTEVSVAPKSTVKHKHNLGAASR